MSYPLDAFVKCNPDGAKPGSLLKVRDMWALKVQRQEGDRQAREEMLILHGPNSGKMGLAPNGEAVTIADPYDWQIFVEAIDGDRNSNTWPAVSIGTEDPVIHGHHWDDPLEAEAATITGERVQVNGVQQYLPNFSVWLVAPNGRQLGDAPLFSVYSPARQPRA